MKKVIVVVEGGVVQNVDFPEGFPSDVAVVIRDFDTDGAEESELLTLPEDPKFPGYVSQCYSTMYTPDWTLREVEYEKIVATAREKYALHSDDDLEIDDDPTIAPGGDPGSGTWVQSWVWVPSEETGEGED